MNIVARTAGWRSTLSNGARQRKPTKTKQMQRPFFNKLRIKAKENWYYPICSFKFCWGSVGDALWNARPKMRRYLQRVNCHFIRALCAPSVLSCGSCRTVMDSSHLHIRYCHFLISRDLCWRAFGTEHACESPRHGSQQACLPCTLCFLSLCALKT